MDIEAIVEEIEFQKEMCGGHDGGLMNPCWGIPLNSLYSILANNIPEFKNYFNGTITSINTSELASLPTATF